MVTALHDGGLPCFASSDVSVGSAVSPNGGSRRPDALTVAAGMAECGKGLGGGGEVLRVVFGESTATVVWGRDP